MPVREKHLLILGGTGEAVALAQAAAAVPGLAVTSSLAGRTAAPRLPPGAMRRGGFGGADGLAEYLKCAMVDLLVDATHPFARNISQQARQAADAAGVPRLQLMRPAWQPVAGDHWISVPHLDAAAAALPAVGKRALITTGARGLAAFSSLEGVMLVVRLIEAPDAPLPFTPHAIVLGRGPFALDEERRLLHRYAIDVVVSKASGGAATSAKLDAAREAGIPMIMVERPPPEAGAHAATIEEALAWIGAELGGRERLG